MKDVQRERKTDPDCSLVRAESHFLVLSLYFLQSFLPVNYYNLSPNNICQYFFLTLLESRWGHLEVSEHFSAFLLLEHPVELEV